MAEKLIPRSIARFTEYIKVAYAKAKNNLEKYEISPDKLKVITPIYTTYIQAETIAANPETATASARHIRNEARKILESSWRNFINECIRYNPLVSASDLEVFGIKKRDKILTRVGVPNIVPALSIKQIGVRQYKLSVVNSTTGKRKKPKHAAGSYIYIAITEPGKMPEHSHDYHKMSFSTSSYHFLDFPVEQLAKQANIYARYSNSHGKEGPENLSESIIIG
jgi:hypothetical protein